MKLLIYLLLTISLVACGQLDIIGTSNFHGPADNQQLMRVVVEKSDGGFSGLLALTFQNGDLDYKLLDSSGITLLSGGITKAGEQQIQRVIGPLKESQLPQFLGDSLAAIYYGPELKIGCQRQGLWENCFEHQGQNTVKRRFWGPFLLTTVRLDYLDQQLVKASYENNWPEVRLTLQPLGQESD